MKSYLFLLPTLVCSLIFVQVQSHGAKVTWSPNRIEYRIHIIELRGKRLTLSGFEQAVIQRGPQRFVHLDSPREILVRNGDLVILGDSDLPRLEIKIGRPWLIGISESAVKRIKLGLARTLLALSLLHLLYYFYFILLEPALDHPRPPIINPARCSWLTIRNTRILGDGIVARVPVRLPFVVDQNGMVEEQISLFLREWQFLGHAPSYPGYYLRALPTDAPFSQLDGTEGDVDFY